MKHTISATELARRLGDVLARVRYRHEHFVVERNGARSHAWSDEEHFRAVPGARVVTLAIGEHDIERTGQPPTE